MTNKVARETSGVEEDLCQDSLSPKGGVVVVGAGMRLDPHPVLDYTSLINKNPGR